jgi:hypothetical protein
VTKSLEQYEAEFNKLYQNLSDSLDNRLITGVDYDRVSVIMWKIYPDESRLANIEDNSFDGECDPDDLNLMPMLSTLFEVTENKAHFIDDFRKAIRQCGSFDVDAVAASIIQSR